jgi:rhamnose transport system ATP-binding protein
MTPADRVAVLRVVGITKIFGTANALSDVSFSVTRGEVHALVGENGAGKSTLVKIVTGIFKPSSGHIELDGERTRFDTPVEARRAGVAAVYQDPKLFPHLDVAENISMGATLVTALGVLDRKAVVARARKSLARIGTAIDPHALIAELSVAELQFVEIARALVADLKLLILDEPTSSLTPTEAEKLFRIVRDLRDHGTAILFITHRLEELTLIADAVTILRDGRHVATRPAAEMSRTEIVRMMVGRPLEGMFVRRAKRTPGREVLRVEGLSRDGAFSNVSFALRAGEIVGMAGLVGSGRSEIAQACFGLSQPTSGRIAIVGVPVTPRSPKQMLALGLAYLPEDRDGLGLIISAPIADNVTLPILGRLAKFGFIDEGEGRTVASEAVETYNIRTTGIDQLVSDLSGGNRQKVAFARWLSTKPKVLILDEPTHGVDIGSKAQIHRIIAQLADNGLAVLVISSDLPEVLGVADRILVVAEGELVAEMDAGSVDQETVMMAATGNARDGVHADGEARKGLSQFALTFRVSGVVAFLLLLGLAFTLLRPQFIAPGNLSAIISNAAILAIVAAAQAVVLITRNLDVSVGSIMGFSAYLTADFAARHPDVGPALFLLPLAIGAALGALNGLLVAYGRVSALIATLGTMSVYRGLTYVYARGQEITSNRLPHWMNALPEARIAGVPLLVVIAVIVVCLLAAFLRFYPLGRRMYAVGSNVSASAFFGLRTQRIVLFAYLLGGGLCGLAGVLYAARVGTVTVVLASGWELASLAAAVIGGVSVAGGSGNVIGAALGAVVLATIDNGLVLLGIPEFWRMFIQGAAIVLAATADVIIAGQVQNALRARRRIARTSS